MMYIVIQPVLPYNSPNFHSLLWSKTKVNTLYILLKIGNEHHRSFHFCRAVLSTHSFFFSLQNLCSEKFALLNMPKHKYVSGKKNR
jgi:hypothetical protein